VQGPDHHFASTQPVNPLGSESLASLQARALQRRYHLRALLMRSPRTVLDMISRLTRLPAALAIAMPVLCGAALAWWETGQINGVALAFHLVATLTLALGVHALIEYQDYRRALAANAQRPHEPLITGYGLLVHGLIAPKVALNLGHILVAVSVGCGLWLMLLIGWPSLVLGAATLLLAYTYANPPLAYGYRGWGFGEVGLLFSFGLLPLLHSYYAQTLTLTWLACAVGASFALLNLLVFHNYHLLFEHRDWLMRKRTLVVVLKPWRALDVSALLGVAVHIGIVATVSLAQLPFTALLTLVTLPVALSGFARIDRERLVVEDYFQLYKSGVTAAIWTGLLFTLALVADKVL